MPELREVISKHSIEHLLGEAKEAFLAMLEENSKTKDADSTTFATPLVKWDRAWEVTETFLRYVHSRMHTMKNLGSSFNPPWVRLVRSNFTNLVMEMADGMISRNQAYQLAADLSFALKANRLAMPLPENKGLWLVAPWPYDLELKHINRRSLSARDEMDIARQEFREAQVDRPVKSDVDLTILDLPDPTPESVMDYVKRLLFAHKQLRKLHAGCHERTAVLEAEVKAWEEKFKELDNPWRDVVKGIGESVHDMKFHENGVE